MASFGEKQEKKSISYFPVTNPYGFLTYEKYTLRYIYSSNFSKVHEKQKEIIYFFKYESMKEFNKCSRLIPVDFLTNMITIIL